MTELSRTKFDYSTLDVTTKAVLDECARGVGDLAKETAINMWKMGRLLSQAQRKLAKHGTGTFQQWVETELKMHPRMAYRLINVYDAFDSDKLSGSKFQASALYLLARPTTPPEVRQAAIQRADHGETITWTKAQGLVTEHNYRPPVQPPPVRMPPSPEYRAFERERLLPKLHDAGRENAPQVLSGREEEPAPAPEGQVTQAKTRLRASIAEQFARARELDEGDQEGLDECADEIMEVLGQSYGSLAIAFRFGVELARGPRTLLDLVEVAMESCGQCRDGMEREQFLMWHKRAKRAVDGISYTCGVAVFEHRLANGQLCYSLLEETSS